MAATATPLLLYLRSFNHPSLMDHQSKLQQPMFSILSFFTFIVISSSILILSLYKRLKKTEQRRSNSIIECALSKTIDETRKTHETNLTQLTHSLLLEILPSHSPKWPTLFSGDVCDEPVPNEPGLERERIDSGGEDCGKKKKKKRAKKKRPNPEAEDGSEERGVGKEGSGQKEKQELVCLYPFTSSSSATQRKIKQQYDQLVKSNESNGLTLAQVGQFINCLIEAKNGLQHKNSQNMNIVVTIDIQASHDRFLSDSGFSRSGVIHRKFTITKALLFKADRSSFDRLHQQIYKLELEQKRLEEDAFVYNWLQQQLKLSPAYKKMLEIGACMELKAKSGEMMESTDSEFGDISFEELLAKEKKDSFWQRNGRARSCSG